MPWMDITCGGCGHRDDFDRFTVSPMGLQLPALHYQCPACGCAWKVERRGQARLTESGFVIPAGRKVVGCQGSL